MKKLFLIISVFASLLSAQGRNIPAFGGAGGFTPIWVIPKMDELNKSLLEFGVPELSTSGFIGYGGSGFAYIMVIDNFRVGGMGFGASTSSEALDSEFNKESIYNLGMGALTLEYTLPISKGFGISIGAMIGGGSVEIELYKNKGQFSYDGVWEDLAGSTENFSRKLSSEFFSLIPTINIDIPLSRFLFFRVGGGYMLNFGNDWTVENNQKLLNVPDELNSNSFFIQTGIFVGFLTI